jgi:transcriptional regulator with XRE-family HTH domain
MTIRKTKPVNPVVGDLLKAIAGSGKTQQEIATEAGVDPSIISIYKRGRNAESIETLQKFGAAVGLKLTWEFSDAHEHIVKRPVILTPCPRITWQQKAILDRLQTGRTVTMDHLVETVYFNRDEPENAENIIRVQISRLRKMFGHVIENDYQRGYRLIT